jgi:gluconate 2-dehydrogenase gamma chain
MSDEKKSLSRRSALKIIGAGFGVVSSLPILPTSAQGQHTHGHPPAKSSAPAGAAPATPRFFTVEELALVTVISDLIIPTDEQSPGAKAAGVPAFIDLMVSESPQEIKKLWRNGLGAVEAMSRKKFSSGFTSASVKQQTELLTDISKDERQPSSPEEHFWVAIKNLTIDGYYTSEIGIHQDLRYKGNSYVKEFAGCTHQEHKA